VDYPNDRTSRALPEVQAEKLEPDSSPTIDEASSQTQHAARTETKTAEITLT